MPTPAVRRPAGPVVGLHRAVLLAAAFVALGIIIVTVQSFLGPLRVTVATDHVMPAVTAPGGLTNELLDGGVVFDPDGVVEMRVDDPSAAQAVVAGLATLPTAVLVLAVLVLLARAVGGDVRTEPFQAGLARRLRRLGVLCLVGGPLAWVVESWARYVLVDTISRVGPAAEITLLAPGFWILAALGLLTLAAVVDHGRSMRTELDGLV